MSASLNTETSIWPNPALDHTPISAIHEHDMREAALTRDELCTRMMEAQDFHTRFLASTHCDTNGLHLKTPADWANKFIRRNADIPSAVLAKLGSNTIAKRRPQYVEAFLAYIARCYKARATLQLRLVAGPVKNVKRYGAYQSADMAEYLTLMQLARVVESITAIYPYGVRVQMVPDDKRGCIANAWPQAYSQIYIASLQRLVKGLKFDSWLTVEEGQARLYEHYRVADHFRPATAEIMDDPAFAIKLERACSHARENLCTYATNGICEQDVQDSAVRYMVAHKAEMLSGMWSPVDALPLVYANHPENYQLYTMGRGLTKLPWQIRLPFSALTPQDTGFTAWPDTEFAQAS